MSEGPQHRSARVVVEASEVAGGFYCEHAFFAAKDAAPAALVGFIHVPPVAQPRDCLTARHGAIREVLTCALRDVVARTAAGEDHRGHEARARAAATRRSCRVLLTGYGPWGEVQHNPSGDFVSHQSNLRAVLTALQAKTVRRRGGVAHGVVEGVDVAIAVALLAVDDSAIDGGPRSLQQAIAVHRPDVVIGLGVHRQSGTISVECRATDVSLVPCAGGFVRDPRKSEPSTILRDDRLYRCVLSGWRHPSALASASFSSSSASSSA